jgi:hypothetical protein
MFVQRLKDAREACGTKVCAASQPGPKGVGAVLIGHNAMPSYGYGYGRRMRRTQ